MLNIFILNSSYSGSQENSSEFTPPLSQTTVHSQDSQQWEDNLEPISRKRKIERDDKTLLGRLLKEISARPENMDGKDSDMTKILKKLGEQQDVLQKITETNQTIVEQFQILLESEKAKTEERKQTQDNFMNNLEQFKKEVIVTTQKAISDV